MPALARAALTASLVELFEPAVVVLGKARHAGAGDRNLSHVNLILARSRQKESSVTASYTPTNWSAAFNDTTSFVPSMIWSSLASR